MRTSIAVVIPAYKVKSHIVELVSNIPDYVSHIIVVDDACPEGSGKYLQENSFDARLNFIFHELNGGVGAAVKSGYRKACELKADIVVKLDGDGQMDPKEIAALTKPLTNRLADYAKGNRFDDIEVIRIMPRIRIIGNLLLSFFAKLSTGYWNVFDPNNGYTAVRVDVLKKLPLDKIEDRYFFESDMLFRLNLIRAKVIDVPMQPKYGIEQSNLKIGWIIPEFMYKHLRNTWKRILYNYYFRDFNLASIELPVGLALSIVGLPLGLFAWRQSIVTRNPAPTGTIVLVALLLLMSTQLILAFFNFDINHAFANRPRRSHEEEQEY